MKGLLVEFRPYGVTRPTDAVNIDVLQVKEAFPLVVNKLENQWGPVDFLEDMHHMYETSREYEWSNGQAVDKLAGVRD
jgi:hypothetical protein